MFEIKVISPDSGREYKVKQDTHGVVSCSCQAWRYQSVAPDSRVCKHIAGVAEGLVAHIMVAAGQRQGAHAS